VGCSILYFHPSPQIITTKIQVWSYREPLYSTPLLFIWKKTLRVVIFCALTAHQTPTVRAKNFRNWLKIFGALTAHQTPTVRAKNFRNWLKIFGALTSANLYIYIPFNGNHASSEKNTNSGTRNPLTIDTWNHLQ
jgi:hypothetical protein